MLAAVGVRPDPAQAGAAWLSVQQWLALWALQGLRDAATCLRGLLALGLPACDLSYFVVLRTDPATHKAADPSGCAPAHVRVFGQEAAALLRAVSPTAARLSPSLVALWLSPKAFDLPELKQLRSDPTTAIFGRALVTRGSREWIEICICVHACV